MTLRSDGTADKPARARLPWMIINCAVAVPVLALILVFVLPLFQSVEFRVRSKSVFINAKTNEVPRQPHIEQYSNKDFEIETIHFSAWRYEWICHWYRVR